MSNKFLTMTAVIGLFAGAVPVFAQEVGGEEYKADKNSPYCSFTYFSNGPDTLDFRGSAEQRCFDMKGGADTLILNRAEFPAGVKVFSGTGRDTVWATDAADYVFDPDGMDKEIRTYGGDDVIEIETEFDRDPFRGIDTAARTIVKPGAGNNFITFGRKVKSNAISRTSPDIWLTTDSNANDSVYATCGHPTLSADYDIRTLEVPETSTIKYDMDGCHLGVFGMYGDADVRMIGGRLALQTYSEGFRVPDGENLPQITGQVEGGMSLMLDLDKTSPKSNFSWEGEGSVFIRSRISNVESGGGFHIRSAREIHYQGDVSAGDVHFDLAAKGVVKVDLVARGHKGASRFTLAASRMDVSWRLAGEGGFPEISNDAPITYQETTFVVPEIDWSATEEQDAGTTMIVDPDARINASLPLNEYQIQKVSAQAVIEPGQTRLRLQLRRDNDRFGKCVSVRVVDMDGASPEVAASCVSLSDALTKLVIEDAASYEQIVIWGDGVDLEIPINGVSRFNVDRIEADL